MRFTQYFFFLTLIVISNTLVAQTEVAFSEQARQSISLEDQQKIRSAIAPRLAEYERILNNLTDSRNNQINRDNARAFEKLFTLNGKLLNDLREEPEDYLITVVGYLELIEDYFLLDGLLFSINSAVVTNATYDPSLSRYIVDVTVNKSVENFFTADGDVEQGDRNYDLKFAFTFKEDDPGDARISTISLKSGVFAADYVRILGLGFSGGVSSVGFIPSALYGTANSSAASMLNVEAGTELGVGAFMLSNFFNAKKSPSKNLFLALSADLLRTEVTAEITDYATSREITVLGEIPQGNLFSEVDRLASGVDALETQNITSLRLGVGLSYRLFSGDKSAAFISVQYAPSFVMASTGRIDGSGLYDIGKTITIDGQEFSFSTADENTVNPSSDFNSSYDIGEQNFSDEPELSTKLSHGLLFSGTFLQDLLNDSPTYGIALGVQYYLPLTTPWDLNAAAEANPFLYTNEENSSYVEPGVLSTFTEDVKVGSFGLSLRVYLKNTRRP